MTDHLPPEQPRSRLRLTGPDALVAAIPYMLGFTPQNSLVVSWIGADLEVEMSMRVDIPPRAMSEPDGPVGEALVATVLGPIPRLSATSTPVVLLYPGAVAEGGALPAAGLARTVEEALNDRGRPPLDVMCVDGNRWWSYLCTTPTCCDLCGNEVSEAVALDVQARFVAEGKAPRATRDDLVTELAAAPTGVVRRMRVLIRDTGFPLDRKPRRGPVPLTPVMRERLWRPLSQLAAGDDLDLHDQAACIAGLRDLWLRDAFMSLSLRHGGRAVTDQLAALVRLAPRHFVAQPAVALAALRYFEGDGARAWVALDRCYADDPQCSLAVLLAHAVGGGIPPRQLRELWAALDPDDLRYGRVRADAAS